MTHYRDYDSRRFRVPIVGWLYHYWHRLRRVTDAYRWTARLVKLPTFEHAPETGLVLVQIDGLSQAELERALASEKMPYLNRLRKSEGYRLGPMYSGLPSTTPAVQGELFYGLKAAVPAFAFGERENGKVVDMLSPETVKQVEDKLATHADGTLSGGSSYCNIYRGGAREPHFSAATMGWNEMFQDVRPWTWILILLWNFSGLLRIGGKLLFESVLIVGDLLLGLVGRRDLKREWEFIRSRLGVGVVLEELMTMAACLDVTRGLPLVQFNFLSFDERGHLRGPGSPLAHRALRRIDKAIERVARAAHHSEGRHYVVWIYSDHGQEASTVYDEIAGQTFVEAVATAFSYPDKPISNDGGSNAFSRYRYLRKYRSVTEAATAALTESPSDPLIVAAVGPVGHLYLPKSISPEQIDIGCRSLCESRHVPLVLRKQIGGGLQVWAKGSVGLWPKDAVQWIGEDHPFRPALVEDVLRLCNHPRAGDVVTLGWRHNAPPMSFVKERGAHGGMGPRETGAFTLLPHEAPVFASENSFLRPGDLRNGVLQFLGRKPPLQGRSAARSKHKTLRIVSYNVHSCVGLDGRLSPERIARVLARCDADVVCLQELDVQRARTGHINQVEVLARLLEMGDAHFHPAISGANEHYGDAILSRLPLKLVRAATLPGTQSRPKLEPRGALWVAAEWNGCEVQIINTHLGLLTAERGEQVSALLGEQWLGHPQCQGPTIFCGDLNTRPNSATYHRIAAEFGDCQNGRNGCRPLNTWFGPFPLARIDHLFVRGALKVVHVEVPRTPLTMVASDHMPLVVDLEMGCDTR